MSTVFIFHGVGGHSGENWFPWIKEQLDEEGHHAIAPDFPHTDHPKLEEWLELFKRYESDLNEETIFIGHSLGGAFALRLLERMEHPIKAMFLVASVWGTMGNKYDPVMTTFTEAPYNWIIIRNNCPHVEVLHADNDPYIRLSLAEELAKNLGTKVTLIRDGKHLNEAAGFTEFPQLLTRILKQLQQTS
ncbi:MAG: alpha/beta fold hydrolase [Candidatus Peribacteraceae bacterium]|jgi:hypothetical protein